MLHSGHGGLPWAGTTNFGVAIGVQSTGTAILMLGSRATSIPLAFLGQPGCHLLVDPSGMLTVPVPVVNLRGERSLPLPPGASGVTLFAQFLALLPGGLALSDGLRFEIR